MENNCEENKFSKEHIINIFGYHYDYSWKGIKKLISYSYPLIPNSISWWIINVSDRTIINLFLGAASNGIYAIACKIPNLCSNIFAAFNISWQEAATEMIDDKESNSYFNQVYNTMYITLLSLCWGILSCNFILFRWVFDGCWYWQSLRNRNKTVGAGR